MLKRFTGKQPIFLALVISLMLPISIAPAKAAEDIKIGVISALSGPLKPYGDAYLDGLKWGLSYYTNGKNSIGGRKIVLSVKDEASATTSATSTFKEMVSNGTAIIAGTTNPTVALTLAQLAQQSKTLYISGPARSDAITSAANKYVFRSGNTYLQEFAALSALKNIRNKKVILFVEDNASGAFNIFAAKAYLASKGAIFNEIRVPESVTEFTTYAKRAAELEADYIIVSWSNSVTAASIYTALSQQKVFASARPIADLGGVASYDATGALFEGVNAIFTSSYFPGVVKNKAAKAISSEFAKSGKSQDLYTADGVNAALMILQALKANPTLNTEKMITNLEGYQFVGLKGLTKVDPVNHALIQTMYLVKLIKVSGHFLPSLVATQYNTKV